MYTYFCSYCCLKGGISSVRAVVELSYMYIPVIIHHINVFTLTGTLIQVPLLQQNRIFFLSFIFDVCIINKTGLNVERCYIGISIVDMLLAYLSVNDDVCWLIRKSVTLSSFIS